MSICYQWLSFAYSRSHRTIRHHQELTCTCSNLIYIIIYTRCNILYVGETMRRLVDSGFTKHLRSIKCNLDGFPVTRHFNPPSSCTLNDIRVMGPFIPKVITKTGWSRDCSTSSRKQQVWLFQHNSRCLPDYPLNFCLRLLDCVVYYFTILLPLLMDYFVSVFKYT